MGHRLPRVSESWRSCCSRWARRNRCSDRPCHSRSLPWRRPRQQASGSGRMMFLGVRAHPGVAGAVPEHGLLSAAELECADPPGDDLGIWPALRGGHFRWTCRARGDLLCPPEVGWGRQGSNYMAMAAIMPTPNTTRKAPAVFVSQGTMLPIRVRARLEPSAIATNTSQTTTMLNIHTP